MQDSFYLSDWTLDSWFYSCTCCLCSWILCKSLPLFEQLIQQESRCLLANLRWSSNKYVNKNRKNNGMKNLLHWISVAWHKQVTASVIKCQNAKTHIIEPGQTQVFCMVMIGSCPTTITGLINKLKKKHKTHYLLPSPLSEVSNISTHLLLIGSALTEGDLVYTGVGRLGAAVSDFLDSLEAPRLLVSPEACPLSAKHINRYNRK